VNLANYLSGGEGRRTLAPFEDLAVLAEDSGFLAEPPPADLPRDLAYPVVYAYFVEARGWSRIAAGALLGVFCGFLWDALQGGMIEYATYNVSLAAMLVDSAYHTAEGALAGTILGAVYKPPPK